MGNFKTINAVNLNGDNVNAKTMQADEYKNLPKSSSSVAGVVKIDGQTIVENPNGTISIKLPSSGADADEREHMADANIHVSNEDRRNLINLDTHLNRKDAHFQFEEKQKVLGDLLKVIDELKSHSDKKHLYEDVDKVIEHLADTSKHFDDASQKLQFLEAMTNSVKVKQGVVDKILITNEEGNVTLSSIRASILQYFEDMTEPISKTLEKYSQSGHTHDEFTPPDFGWHTNDATVHFEESEKTELLDDIRRIGESIDGLYERTSDTSRLMEISKVQKKVKARYIRHTLFTVNPTGEDLDWINMAVYRDGVNIAPTIPASSVTTNMAWTDMEILKWLDGNTTVVTHKQACTDLAQHWVMIDLGEERSDTSHIRIHNGLNHEYETKVEVSIDGVKWTTLYDSELQGKYCEDKYGKIHILNYEPYTDYLKT